MTPAGLSYSSANHGDDLATLLVRRLEYRRGTRSWGLIKTLVLGVPSFGLIPLLAWSAGFRDFASEDSQAVQELAQWTKLRGRQPAAIGPLMAAADGATPSPLPLIAALLLSALVFGVFAIEFSHVPFSLDTLIDMTYSRAAARLAASSPLGGQEFVYRVWVIGLSLGYAIQWLHVRAHSADIRRFVDRFNPVVQAEGLPAVHMPMGAWIQFRPLWILTAIVLATYGAWWGIPMVLAGMAQKRYTDITAWIVRRELAKRVRDVVTLRQVPVAPTFAPVGRCTNPRCLATIRAYARFCARCGAAIGQERSA